jgi:osmotically-inducible protein OsmY
MVAARHDPIGLLLAAALGVAALAARPPALAQALAAQVRDEATQPEVIITGTRPADAALTAKVVTVLQDDPYVFAGHISVVTENGIVTLQGIAFDASDLRGALMLARRVAGRCCVVNNIELIPEDLDAD